jgi:hypothetical protein
MYYDDAVWLVTSVPTMRLRRLYFLLIVTSTTNSVAHGKMRMSAELFTVYIAAAVHSST